MNHATILTMANPCMNYYYALCIDESGCSLLMITKCLNAQMPTCLSDRLQDFVLFCLFMYTASVMFDYYCRDSELSYIGGIGFQFR